MGKTPALSASVLPVAIAAVAGVVLWIAASVMSGKREAWDADIYWTVAYPVALALCGLLGIVWPRKPWRWALALFLFQFVGMAIRNGELGGLWPLGLILLAVLSLPGMLVAQLGARFRSRFMDKAG
jgi:peptidoglycan/LPS O-acetylase OafA/YrhL